MVQGLRRVTAILCSIQHLLRMNSNLVSILSEQWERLEDEAHFMSYLQERGSVDDFVEYARNKRKRIQNEFQEEKMELQRISDEIEDKEKDLKATEDFVKQKEEELELLKRKLSKLQKEVTDLHGKRSASTEACEILEKRMKNLEDHSMLFQSLMM